MTKPALIGPSAVGSVSGPQGEARQQTIRSMGHGVREAKRRPAADVAGGDDGSAQAAARAEPMSRGGPGSCQRPTSRASTSAAAGPQVPGS